MEALAIVEYGAVATGLAAVDALTKRATVDVRGAGTVEPGKFLVLFTGVLAEVEESYAAAVDRGGDEVRDRELIADVHPSVVPALQGAREVGEGVDCVGVVEGRSVAGTVLAADRACKDADVVLAGFRIQPGLGGRAYFAVTGLQHDVEAAVEAAGAALGGRLHRVEVVPRPTADLLRVLLSAGAFTVG